MQACPRCERMDAVAKVSGIVSAGTKDRFDSGVQVRPPLATGGGEWSVDLTQTSYDVVYVPGSPESCVAPEQAATSVLHYKG
jgi:hypothetical protein